ncbi:hypothetical protein [Sporosarcina limicola]|uniref:Uncharacterized protein n=1 Tax=Sporosarcina limicola TaxID=34101 RepID=A0A927R8K7_9BACL|nr:hypothetical protein [Sporosarcina limicola]MBE1557099.1 hypothetical protein [Sporosarcina limicola]
MFFNTDVHDVIISVLLSQTDGLINRGMGGVKKMKLDRMLGITMEPWGTSPPC